MQHATQNRPPVNLVHSTPKHILCIRSSIGDRKFFVFFHSILFLSLSYLCATHAIAQDSQTGKDATVNFINTPDGCSENSPWCKTFFFGVQFLPDYGENEDGDGSSFSGLNEQAFFGQFNFDAVYKPKYTWFSDKFDWLRPQGNSTLDNFGLSVNLYESGSIKDTGNADGMGQMPNAMSDNTDASTLSSFNQITGTVGIEAYRSFNWFGTQVKDIDGKPIGSGSAYGPKIILGTRTRESSAKNEDTLSSYGAVGFNYAFYKPYRPYKETRYQPANCFLV